MPNIRDCRRKEATKLSGFLGTCGFHKQSRLPKRKNARLYASMPTPKRYIRVHPSYTQVDAMIRTFVAVSSIIALLFLAISIPTMNAAGAAVQFGVNIPIFGNILTPNMLITSTTVKPVIITPNMLITSTTIKPITSNTHSTTSIPANTLIHPITPINAVSKTTTTVAPTQSANGGISFPTLPTLPNAIVNSQTTAIGASPTCAPPSTYNPLYGTCSAATLTVSSSTSASQMQSISTNINVYGVVQALPLAEITTNANPITIKCSGCSSNGGNTQGITIMSANTVLATGIIRGMVSSAEVSSARTVANAIATNALLVSRIVNYFTPEGFSISNTSVLGQSSAKTTGNVAVQWAASEDLGHRNVSRSTLTTSGALGVGIIIPAMSLMQSGVDYAVRYVNTSKIMVSSSVEVHAFAVVKGNASTMLYVPSNVTTYSGGSSAAVSITNLVVNSSSSVNTSTIWKTPLSSIKIMPKQNLTTLVAGIRVYKNTSNGFANGIIATQFSSNVISIIVINSSVSDSLIGSVQYGFNLSKSALAARGVGTDSVHLFRYNKTSGTWLLLPISMTGSDDTQYFFSAKSPGFSVYALAFGYIDTRTNYTTIPTTTVPQQFSFDSGMISKAAIIVAAIVLVVGVVYILMLKKREPEFPTEIIPDIETPPEEISQEGTTQETEQSQSPTTETY